MRVTLSPADMLALPSASLTERALMPVDGKTAHKESCSNVHWSNSIKDNNVANQKRNLHVYKISVTLSRCLIIRWHHSRYACSKLNS